MLSVVIVEDEVRSREVLKNLLREYCEGVRIDGMASTVKEGVDMISTIQPDIVFLDVELHPGTGFDLLEQICSPTFEVVFTTAYDHYALKAIKVSAISYLMKPIDIQELQEAVDKIRIRKEEKLQGKLIEHLLSNVKSKGRCQKLALKTNAGVKFVTIDEISYCQADGSYTHIHLTSGEKLLQSKNLKEFEDLFEEHDFLRVHHSYLVNINEVDSCTKSPSYQIIMKDGTSISVSSKRKDEFMTRMNLK